jgi:hypothetical protein
MSYFRGPKNPSKPPCLTVLIPSKPYTRDDYIYRCLLLAFHCLSIMTRTYPTFRRSLLSR